MPSLVLIIFSSISKQPRNQQISAHGYVIMLAWVPHSVYYQVENRSLKQASFSNIVWYQCLTNTIRRKFILKINHCSTDWGYTICWINKKNVLKCMYTQDCLSINIRRSALEHNKSSMLKLKCHGIPLILAIQFTTKSYYLMSLF